MANTIRDPGREKRSGGRPWQDIAKSGLSVREFCRRERLHESAFYFWRRTIQDAAPSDARRKPPAFVPLVLGDVHTAAGITLELRGGRSLRLSESFPVDRLASLVLALEAEEGRP